MNTTRKRSWETALGTGNPELNPQGLQSTGHHHPSPTITPRSSLDQDTETASPTLSQPDLHAIYSYEEVDDVQPKGDGRYAFTASPEPADLLRDVDLYISENDGVFDESSSNAVSSPRTFSTPRSVEEQGRPTGPSPATVVCYGQILNISARFFPAYQRSSIQEPQRESSYTIRVRADGITFCDADAQEVGEMDNRHASIIKKIKLQVPNLWCEVFFGIDDKAVTKVAKNRHRPVLTCDMNLYGPAQDAELVGSHLGDANILVQEPTGVIISVPYCNPHVYSRNEDLCTPFFSLKQPEEDDSFDQEIHKILSQSHIYESHPSFAQDPRIKSRLQPHQITALNFMSSRECEDLQSLPTTMWKRDDLRHSPVFVHKLTRERHDHPTNECVGGLLADEMGLGKSLSLLALIVHTLEEAQHFVSTFDITDTNQLPRIGATLIITPYSTLRNWQDEISKHLHPGTIHVHTHHGQTKARSHSDLEAVQVVLTTYETVASSQKTLSGHLNQFSWFRIVLDEAHWIRNTSTQVFRALHEFKAQRRWCMTGTPVQNGLNDICAITRWLRFYPFDTSQRFRKFITGPLHQRSQQGLDNLRHMMRVFQVRRVKADMDLCAITPSVIKVALSSSERDEYETVKAQLFKELASLAGRKRARSSITNFQGIHKLRRICCDGLALRAPEERYDTDINTSDLVISCSICDAAVDEKAWRSIFRGHCGHVFCGSCYASSSTNSYDEGAVVVLMKCCLICGVAEDEDGRFLDTEPPSRISVLSNQHQPPPEVGDFVSAKILIVTRRLVEIHQGSAESSGKSLVFSYWKNALMSLESQLQKQNVSCVRIDGDRSADERTKALTAFRTQPEVKVMLITFGTGSVGLTLTEATHVHLVEPHWNPMVEEQAIARAHRIGQDKPVSVWRYIVENSIEENIARKQQRKLYLAKLTHDDGEGQSGGSGDRKSGQKKLQADDENKIEDLLEECHLLQG